MTNTLVENKLPLVVADYRTYFDSASRLRDEIYRARQWEVTLVAAVAFFLGRYGVNEPIAVIPIVFLILVFWAQDAANRISLLALHKRCLDVENRLTGKTPEEFNDAIENWEFSNTFYGRTAESITLKGLAAAMSRKNILMFHGALAVFSMSLILIGFGAKNA